MVFIRMLTLYKNIDLVEKLLPTLRQSLFQVKKEQHLKLAKSMQNSNLFLFRLCVYSGLQTYAIYSLIPFLSKERSLLSRGWFPFDWRVSPYYEMVYVFQNFVALWSCLTCFNMDTFTTGLLMFVGLQCDFLCLDLNDMGTSECDRNELKKIETGTGLMFIDVEDRNFFSRRMCNKLIVCVEHYKEIKG